MSKSDTKSEVTTRAPYTSPETITLRVADAAYVEITRLRSTFYNKMLRYEVELREIEVAQKSGLHELAGKLVRLLLVEIDEAINTYH